MEVEAVTVYLIVAMVVRLDAAELADWEQVEYKSTPVNVSLKIRLTVPGQKQNFEGYVGGPA
jgi:hypothetical protein